jgi:hypothetical protein
MTTAPRGLLPRLAGVLLTAGLVTSGCGGGSTTATDDPTTPASSPTTTDPTSDATTGATHAATDGSTEGADLSSDDKLVEVAKYGISYRVPHGWISVDGQDLLRADNPVLKQVAGRMGVTVDQLISTIGANIQAYSVSNEGATNGVLDTVNMLGVPVSGLTGSQLKVQLASIGAKPGKAVTAHTPVGGLTRLPYAWKTTGRTIYGVSMAVDLGTATAQITVSAHDAASARKIADLVQGSLRRA